MADSENAMEDMPFSEEKHDSEYLFYDFKNRAAGKGTSFGEKKEKYAFRCVKTYWTHIGEAEYLGRPAGCQLSSS